MKYQELAYRTFMEQRKHIVKSPLPKSSSASFKNVISSQPRAQQKDLLRAKGLWKVTSLLANATTKKHVAEIIINEVFHVLDAVNGDITLMRSEREIDIIAYKGYPKDFLTKWAKLPENTPLLTNVVLKTKKPVYIPSVHKLDMKYEVAKLFLTTSGAQSASLIPLIYEEKIIGIMQFAFRTPQKFKREDKLFINTLANQCANAFVRVAAQEELKDTNQQLEVILKNSADGILLHDKAGNIVYTNYSCAKLLGFSSTEELRKLPIFQIFNKFMISDENNNPFLLFTTNMQEGKVMPKEKILKFIQKKTNELRWISYKSTKVSNFSHNGDLYLITFHDHTSVKELDRRKDEFISLASHELKTPLTSMKLFLQLLSGQLKKNNDTKSLFYSDKIVEQATRLQKHIADLLDVSRIQKGKLHMSSETFRLDELVKNTVDDLQLFTKTHSFIIESSKPYMVKADRFRLYQVITNLVNNAVKYSPGKKKVHITIERMGNNVRVSVKDYGIGISKDKQAKIFDRFYQVEPTSGKNQTGLGIGLFISSEIIKSHQGKIWTESALGKGTTVHFTLPLLKSPRKFKSSH